MSNHFRDQHGRHTPHAVDHVLGKRVDEDIIREFAGIKKHSQALISMITRELNVNHEAAVRIILHVIEKEVRTGRSVDINEIVQQAKPHFGESDELRREKMKAAALAKDLPFERFKNEKRAKEQQDEIRTAYANAVQILPPQALASTTSVQQALPAILAPPQTSGATPTRTAPVVITTDPKIIQRRAEQFLMREGLDRFIDFSETAPVKYKNNNTKDAFITNPVYFSYSIQNDVLYLKNPKTDRNIEAEGDTAKLLIKDWVDYADKNEEKLVRLHAAFAELDDRIAIPDVFNRIAQPGERPQPPPKPATRASVAASSVAASSGASSDQTRKKRHTQDEKVEESEGWGRVPKGGKHKARTPLKVAKKLTGLGKFSFDQYMVQ